MRRTRRRWPLRPRKTLPAAVAAATALLLILLSCHLGRPEARLESLKRSWDERRAYLLEDRLLREAAKTRSLRRRARLHLLLGQVRFLRGLNSPAELRPLVFEKAVEAFTEARQSPPYEAEALFWIGLSRYQSGPEWYGPAVDHLIAALRKGHPDRLRIVKILNYIHLKNRDFDVIIRINEEFLRNRLVDTDVVYSLGRAWREKAEYRKALEVLSRTEGIPEQSPLLPLIRFETAEALTGLGRTEEAAAYYRQVIASSEASTQLRRLAEARLAASGNPGKENATE